MLNPLISTVNVAHPLGSVFVEVFGSGDAVHVSVALPTPLSGARLIQLGDRTFTGWVQEQLGAVVT